MRRIWRRRKRGTQPSARGSRRRSSSRGYRVLPSQTNFVLVDLGRDAAPFERHLFERGVIVRPMGGYGLGESVRISVGSRAENQRLLDALP